MGSGLQLNRINKNAIEYYRFLYRRNKLNNKIYTVSYSIHMNRINISDRVFSSTSINNTDSFASFINTIHDSGTNVNEDDIKYIKDEVKKFFKSYESYLEIILPVESGVVYKQDDIDAIYDAINTVIDAQTKYSINSNARYAIDIPDSAKVDKDEIKYVEKKQMTARITL